MFMERKLKFKRNRDYIQCGKGWRFFPSLYYYDTLTPIKNLYRIGKIVRDEFARLGDFDVGNLAPNDCYAGEDSSWNMTHDHTDRNIDPDSSVFNYHRDCGGDNENDYMLISVLAYEPGVGTWFKRRSKEFHGEVGEVYVVKRTIFHRGVRPKATEEKKIIRWSSLGINTDWQER